MGTQHVLPEESSRAMERLHVVQDPAKVILIYPVSNPEDLFINLYNNYYDRIKQYGLTLYKFQVDRAEDLVQDIFLKLWESKDKLQMIASPGNYLFSMAKNRFIDEHKRKFRNYKMSFEVLEMADGISENTTEQAVLFREAEQILRKGKQKLPMRMGQTMTLKQEGYRIKEIAFLMDISTRTVRNHLQSAKKNLAVSF